METENVSCRVTSAINPFQVIWKALGDYWRQPRENWEGTVLPYRPTFFGGWSPGIVTFPEDDIVLARNGSGDSKKVKNES